MDGATDTLFGTFTPRLDDKGRLTLPARFRAHFAGGIVMIPGQENCLFGFAPRGFEDFEASISSRSLTDASARKMNRFIYANQTRDTPDKQGRVPIPVNLRAWATLDRDCAVVGIRDHIEIWDAERWNEFQEIEGPAYAELNEDTMAGPG